ncbi:methyltransferase domain-containing protein [Actinomycetospora endophytica]|uniref:Methyltransferase domain-containing protein n=1 Tax=Actinomycetospora endophytica TaxID=2291215 RepID=A0ABS8PH53_9PSEU|nr:nicotianamine synthase family protein [Actinomycetospora endophytica]MCD2197575.1 methyltransferase domain-containing protein [Actinomycetospora endophytica]
MTSALPVRRPVGPAEHLADVRGGASRLGVRSCGHADTGSTTAAVVARVRALYEALLARPHLAPEPVTNELFTRLVSLAIDPVAARDADAVLADPAVQRLLPGLRDLCATGEFELERWWAQRVVADPEPRAALAGFPYHQNYRDLTRLEHHAVAGLTSAPVRRVLFIGSGPLPLTSLLLAEQYGCAVDNIDREPEAVRLSASLAGGLGVDGLRFRVGDVLDGSDGFGRDDYDLVYLAALAGLDPESKRGLLDHLARTLRPGTLVLARSAHSLRGLLYPVLDPDDLPGLRTLAVVHPCTEVVNSVVVAEVC